MERQSAPCIEDGAEVFAAGSAVVLVRRVDGTRGRAKYEVKVKRADDCSVVDIVPEVSSLTSKEVAKLLKKAGLTPGEIDEYVKWARRLMSGPSKDEVAVLFREVVKAAEETLSGRLDSPYLDLLIPKRDKETLTDCKPSECWQSANATAVVPAKIDGRFGILDFDSEEALEEAASLGFDPNRHMHILAGPAVDAVLTPEGKWRTPDGKVLDSVPRKLHVPVYIPEGCKHNLTAPGFELKCLGEINIAGRHPSGAEYEFVDGELLEVSYKRLKEFAEELSGLEEFALPECKTTRRVDLDKLTELFSRIYSAAQAAGYSRHDALYDLGILCRLACVPKEDAEEVARRVYGTAGGESQTLSQRLSHIERAYRASREGRPKLRSPNKIYETWLKIDAAAAEEIFKLLDVEVDRVLARECVAEYEIDHEEYGKMKHCSTFVTAEIRSGQMVVAIEHVAYKFEKRNGEEMLHAYTNWNIIYRGPRPKKVLDVVRGTWFFEIGGFYGTSLEQVVEKLRRPGAGVKVYINKRYIDEIVAIMNIAAKEEKAALTVGILPAERGAVLVDDYGVLDTGPSLEEAVADLDKALRSVLAAYPEANHDAALATVGYVLGLNAAPVWWFHKPNAEVPLPIIYGASGLGKSELMRRVVEPAVVGIEFKKRVWELRERIADETLYDFFIPEEVRKFVEYTTAEQLRNDLDTNTLVLILDEQKPGNPRSPKASAKIFGKFWLQVATAEWGRRLAQHAAKYGGGFGYKFFRLRAFAIVTNYSPDEWKKAGLADAVSAEDAIDRRIFEIPWEDVKLDKSKLKLIYTPRYSVLKALEVVINKHFNELMAQAWFPEFVVALWRKVIEDFEPKLGRLEGIRRMVEALERLAQYNLERNKLRDPVVAAWEELRRNALTYLREVAKVVDLSPAKLVAKVVEYAAELGLVFRKPRWADEIDKVRADFCRALAKAVDVPGYDCGEFVSKEIEDYKDPASAPLFELIVDRELREALWKIFVNYAVKGYTPSVVAKSVLWPFNTRYMGKIPRTHGISSWYYKLTWEDFFDVFVGKLVEVEHNEQEESSVGNVSKVSNPPMRLSNLEEQTTNVETAPPTGVDTSQEQGELPTLLTLPTSLPPSRETTNSPDLALWKIFTDYAAKGLVPSVVAGSILWPKNTKMLGRIPRMSLKRPDGTVEHYYKLTWQDFFEVFVGRLVAEDQQTTGEYTIYPGAGVSGGYVVSPPTPLTNLGNQATNVETAAPVNVDTSQGQGGLTTQPPSAGGLPVVSEGAGDSAVVSPQEPLTQIEGLMEEVETASLIGQEQGELTTGPHAPTTAVVNAPSSLPESRGHVANIEPALAIGVDVGQELSGLTTLTPLTTAQNKFLDGKNEVAHLAETAESRKLDSAEACMANPICLNRLKLCILNRLKRLKVPKEERKAALYAEIERRGDLFAYCLKDAVEYTRRVAGP
jgi:hypothetical protein